MALGAVLMVVACVTPRRAIEIASDDYLDIMSRTKEGPRLEIAECLARSGRESALVDPVEGSALEDGSGYFVTFRGADVCVVPDGGKALVASVQYRINCVGVIVDRRVSP